MGRLTKLMDEYLGIALADEPTIGDPVPVFLRDKYHNYEVTRIVNPTLNVFGEINPNELNYLPESVIEKPVKYKHKKSMLAVDVINRLGQVHNLKCFSTWEEKISKPIILKTFFESIKEEREQVNEFQLPVERERIDFGQKIKV